MGMRISPHLDTNLHLCSARRGACVFELQGARQMELALLASLLPGQHWQENLPWTKQRFSGRERKRRLAKRTQQKPLRAHRNFSVAQMSLSLLVSDQIHRYMTAVLTWCNALATDNKKSLAMSKCRVQAPEQTYLAS